MENTITVQGKMDFMDKEIPVVSGGFGKGKMCILAKTVAEIHGITIGEINQNVKRNEKRFITGKDVIDLKNSAITESYSQMVYNKDIEVKKTSKIKNGRWFT